MAAGDDWTEDEVGIVSDAYFAYLWDDDQRPKKQLYQDLHEGSLPDRSEKSIERKFQNLSAVLDERDLPWINGITPASRYQGLLANTVDSRLEARREENYARFRASHPDASVDRFTLDPPLDRWLESVFKSGDESVKCFGTASKGDKQQSRFLQQGQTTRFISISLMLGRDDHDAFVTIAKNYRGFWAQPAPSCVCINFLDDGEWHIGTLVARPGSPFVRMVQRLLKEDVAVEWVDAVPEASCDPTVNPNTILYGPPGTGKTYSTVRRALDICHVPYTDETAQDEYRRLTDDGRIRFVTFHQSFSYEDFVEGIRPVVREESGQIDYEPRDGVFKEICARALVRRGDGGSDIDLESRRFWKMSLGDTRRGDSEVYDSCIRDGVVKLGWGSGIDFSGCDDRGAVLAKIIEADPTYEKKNYSATAVNYLKNEMKDDDLIIVSDGNLKFRAIGRVSGPYGFSPEEYDQVRPVEWLAVFDPSLPREQLFRKAITQMTLYELQRENLKLDQLISLIGSSESGETETCVLIIDEINRANVSKVLGELITLLEPDKRLRAPDERRVVLPYSREEFGVPANVHVLGTMNTADRSIAMLDLALRRRFRFEEVGPDPGLIEQRVGVVEGVPVSKLMEAMNERIEFMLDRDHAIGHSYFLDVGSLDELSEVFQARVIPLLQEYFHGDLTKVAWILRCGFDEDGSTSNDNPILKIRRQSAHALFGEGSDFEDRIHATVNPSFVAANGEGLAPFFLGVLG